MIGRISLVRLLFAAILLAGAAVFLGSASAQGATTVPAGAITAPTTWTLLESPYYVEGDVVVDAGATLTIEGGVSVFFNGPFKLDVRGGFTVGGSYGAPVVFDGNGTIPSSWGGLNLLSVDAPCVMSNLTLRHAQTAFTARTPGAAITATHLRIENASVRAMDLQDTSRPIRFAGLSLFDDREGILLTNVANATFEGVVANRFTWTGAWVVYANTLNLVSLFDFYSAEGEIRMAGATDVTMRNVTIGAPEENWPIMIYGGSNVRLEGFHREDGYTLGPYIDGVGGLVVSELQLVSPVFRSSTESLHLSNSPGARISNFMLAGADTGIAISRSPGVELRNITITDGTTGISLVRCDSFLLDRASILNMTQWGVYLEYSFPGRFANTAIANATNAFRVGSNGGLGELDVAQGNSIDGVPVLGVYNDPGRTVSLEGHSWLYIWGSPNTTILGGNMTRESADVQAVVGGSPGTRLLDVTIHGHSAALYITNSDGTFVERANLTADGQPIYAIGTASLTVRNSTLTTRACCDNAVKGVGMINSVLEDTNIVGGRGILDMGAGNIYRRLNITGNTALETSYGTSILLEESIVCGPISIGAVTNVVIRNITMCNSPSARVTLGGSTLVTIEGVSFDNQSIGISVTGAGQTVIRWNTFRNCGAAGIQISANPGSSVLAYENSFFCGGLSAADSASSTVVWYNETRRHGNFWDDYGGADVDGDLVGDIPWAVPGHTRVDLYPLAVPFDRVPPVARTPALLTADVDRPTQLDGSASTDNVGITNATWWVNETGIPEPATGLIALYRFDSTGSFEARLVVRDAWGNIAEQAVTITVVDRLGPYWEPPVGLQSSPPGLITLSTANAVDFSGVASVVWKRDGQIVATTDDYFGTYREVGNHTVSVRLTDGLGFASDYNVTISVVDSRSPTLSDGQFTRQRNADQSFPFTLDASRAFADNDPAFPTDARYSWSTAAVGASWASQTNASTTIVLVELGDFVVHLRVSDGSGNYEDVDVPVRVSDRSPPTDIIWSVRPEGTIPLGTAAVFSADAADPNGLSFHWDFGDGERADGRSATHTYTRAGSFRVNLTVSDSFGNRANETVTVTVAQAPVGPGPSGADAGGFPVLLVGIGAAGAVAAVLGFILVARKGKKPKLGSTGQPQAPATGPVQEQTVVPVYVEPPMDEYDRLYGPPPQR